MTQVTVTRNAPPPPPDTVTIEMPISWAKAIATLLNYSATAFAFNDLVTGEYTGGSEWAGTPGKRLFDALEDAGVKSTYMTHSAGESMSGYRILTRWAVQPDEVPA